MDCDVLVVGEIGKMFVKKFIPTLKTFLKILRSIILN